jgi:hypothetical protein
VIRSLLPALAVLVGACEGAASEAAPPPPKVESGVDLAKMEVPEHKGIDMTSDPKPMIVTTKGSVTAALNGHPKTFGTLPVGGNAAVWTPNTRVARVLLGGSEDDSGFPALRIVLEGVRLDTLALPATFTFGKQPSAKSFVRSDDPEVPLAPLRPRIVFEIAARKIWESDPEGPEVGSVTIESFDGKRIAGTFSAKLKPRSAAFGPPVDITNGKFDVELRLNGVAPGKPAAPK